MFRSFFIETTLLEYLTKYFSDDIISAYSSYFKKVYLS